jgi:hypothetical protein
MVVIEEIPENQVSSRILRIRNSGDKGDTYFPFSMDILVVNSKTGFRKQGKYLGSKSNKEYTGMIYRFSFDGKVTEIETTWTKNQIKDYKFYIDTKRYTNKKQKDFYCSKLDGKKFNSFGIKGTKTKEDVEQECLNFYKDQNITFSNEKKKIEKEKKQRDKQVKEMLKGLKLLGLKKKGFTKKRKGSTKKSKKSGTRKKK